MTENQTPKDENSQETMNSGDLETVNNTGSDTLSQDENVADSVDFEETATPANASDNTQASETKNTNKKIKNDGKVASFRVSPFSRFSFGDGEGSKSNKSNPLFLFQRSLHTINKSI